MNDGRIEHLTGLRYFAALLVFFSHIKWQGSNEYLISVFLNGHVGVSFFFILSGFVLSYAYENKIKANELSFVKYFSLRVARISPLYFVTALPFLLYYIGKGDFSITKTLVSVFYMQSWVPNSEYYFSFNSPSWSLSNELFFYACFYFLVFLSVKRLVVFFTFLMLFVLSCSIFINAEFPGVVFHGNNSIGHWFSYILPISRLHEFVFGMLCYNAWKRNFSAPGWLVYPSLAMLIISMYFAKYIPEVYRLNMYFFPFISLFFFASLTPSFQFKRLFSSRILVLLGNASFAFYLIHRPLLDYFKKKFYMYFDSHLFFLFFMLFFLTIISVVVYLFFERKAESSLKSLINRRFVN